MIQEGKYEWLIMLFVALDFETANGKRTSICSVGMVKVINNQITESFYTLVNPLITLLKQI